MAKTDNDALTRNKDLTEARDRFKRCAEWEGTARARFLADLKFAEGDSDNNYQWPEKILNGRQVADRPHLTINKTRQHNLQIINDAKQNKPGIAVRPTGGGATAQAADVLEGIMRHIEYQSNASTAYDTATEFQVKAGIGYIRVVTDYLDDTSFNQEVFIRRCIDPLSYYIDPDAKEADKSDMRFAFIFENVPRDVFETRYPEWKDLAGASNIDGSAADWITADHIRICEYFRKVVVEDTLFSIEVDDEQKTVLASKLPPEMIVEIKKDPQVRQRKVQSIKVEWLFIVGDQIKDRADWPGKYIPLVPVIGEETIIEGKMDRKGHTRALKDPQRIYNYWNSASVEFVALQGKTPWVAPAEAIEGYETYWNTANTENHSVLPYNGLNDEGKPIPAPQRPGPPVAAPAYLQGMQTALNDMMFVSGQYQNSMGEQGNERTGKAIDARQRQGENATYHYIDNLAISIRCLGKIILDLIPKIYDTERVMLIMAEDGSDEEIEINPDQKEALAEKQLGQNQAIRRIFNPTVGKYEVEADIGPGYATRRQAAFEAYHNLMAENPSLTSVVGDLLFKAADFPMAEEGAARLKRMVPAQALGVGPTKNEQMLAQQVQNLNKILGDTLDQMAELRLKLSGKEALREVDVFNAETKRIDVLKEALQGPELNTLVQQLVEEALNTKLGLVTDANTPGLESASLEGATQQLSLPFGQEEPNAQ